MRNLHVLFASLFILWLSLGCHRNGKSENPSIAPVRPSVNKEDSSAFKEARKNIVFYGNSLTAGYGVDPSESFPALIQAKMDSLNLPYQVINAGLSGETSAGGNSRINWVLRLPVYIFILELGGNDGLRGIALSETSRNLQSIIDKVKSQYPCAKIILAGMQIPPNLGKTYTSEFRNLFQQLALSNKIILIPFLLEGVGGIPALNQQDGIHPNVPGHKIVAENVWNTLKPLL
jgi:acyl-CoA thioesterase I